jgi:hypothetical protein
MKHPPLFPEGPLFRTLNGVRTKLATPAGIALPHASPSIGEFVVCVTNDGSAVRFLLARDETPGRYDAVVVDSNSAPWRPLPARDAWD